MLMLGVYVLLLSSVSDARSLVVATPVRGRQFPEVEAVMGLFGNLVPLPVELDLRQTLGEFVQHLKDQLVSAMDNQQVPFERFASEPEFTGRARGVGLYQVLFSFEDTRERPSAVGPLRHRQIQVSQRGATEDIGLWLADGTSGLEGGLTYNADIFRRETGAALRNRYVELLQRVVAHPHESLAELVAPGDSPDAAHLLQLSRNEMDERAERAANLAAGTSGAAVLVPGQLKLAQIWADVLKINISEIRPSDNFFDLGGDSLLAMRVIQLAERRLGLRTAPPRYVFENLGQIASGAAAAALGETLSGGNAKRRSLQGRTLFGRMFSAWGKTTRST
jgi:non-ribosomal peptide synthetase component F